MSSKVWRDLTENFSGYLAEKKQSIAYLSKEIKTNPADGLGWWLKNRKQYSQVEQALNKIYWRIEAKDFLLDEVYQFFTSFQFRDDDIAHAEWFQQAHIKIKALDKRLDAGDILIPGIFRGVLNELHYISEAGDFHNRWGLQQLQIKVTTMYEQLLEKIDSLKQLASEAQSLEKKQLLVTQKRLELEKITTQKQALELQKEKAQLLKDKVLQETKRLEIKRKQHIEEQKLFQLKEQQQQNEDENKRKQELQSSYADIANKWDSQVSNNN